MLGVTVQVRYFLKKISERMLGVTVQVRSCFSEVMLGVTVQVR